MPKLKIQLIFLENWYYYSTNWKIIFITEIAIVESYVFVNIELNLKVCFPTAHSYVFSALLEVAFLGILVCCLLSLWLLSLKNNSFQTMGFNAKNA